MPFYSTLPWLRTITPTASGLDEHHDKKQNQSYARSFHRAILLAFNIYSQVLNLLYASLTMPLVHCHINRFRRASSVARPSHGGEKMTAVWASHHEEL